MDTSSVSSYTLVEVTNDQANGSALTSAAKVEVDLFDALPYIDNHLKTNPSIQAEVEALIAQESRRSKKRVADYLAEIEARGNQEFAFKDAPMMALALEQHATGNYPAPKDFTASYSVPLPTGDDERNEEAWKDTIARLKIGYETEALKSMNLELMKLYGANAWLKTAARAEMSKKGLENGLNAVTLESKEVNKKRSHLQSTAGQQLDSLNTTYFNQVKQNHELAYERRRLERIVKKHRNDAALKSKSSTATPHS